ncbi:Laccase domain protein yfiH [Legionella spiritensis]|nr:Laccase domain protein yfiH [Legionella spiritensis]
MIILANIIATWPAPDNIHALTTRRYPGHSLPPYDSNNLGLHVGDNPDHVLKNRADLISFLNLPSEPVWLEQTHSNRCVLVEEDPNRQADAAVTRSPDRVLAIMTADCLPVMLCNRQGTEIAAVHAGWRGLVNGVIDNTIVKMKSDPEELLAWIGPAICPSCYEVGEDVRWTFLNRYKFAADAFQPHQQKWLADLPGLARLVLENAGVSAVYLSNLCTYEQKKDFYSYRREQQTGRMVTLVWFN